MFHQKAHTLVLNLHLWFRHPPRPSCSNTGQFNCDLPCLQHPSLPQWIYCPVLSHCIPCSLSCWIYAPPLVMLLSPHPPVVDPSPCPPMVDSPPHPLIVDSWPHPLVVDLSPCLPAVDPQPQPLAAAPLAKLEVVPPSRLMAHLSRSNDSVHLYCGPIRHMVWKK